MASRPLRHRQRAPLWPWHPEGFVEMIAQRARTDLGMKDTEAVRPNCWAASCRAYWCEQSKHERLARKAAREAKRLSQAAA